MSRELIFVSSWSQGSLTFTSMPATRIDGNRRAWFTYRVDEEETSRGPERFRLRQRWIRVSVGYAAALAGVALGSVAIGIISARVHLANQSMLYLVVVIALGIFFGKGPAVVGSVAAFLADRKS